KPFWQKGAFYASVAAVAAVLAGVFMYINSNDTTTGGNNNNVLVNTNNTNPADSSNTQYTAAGVPAPVYQIRTINTAAQQVIDAGNGISITVAPNSLADASGAPVNGDVELRYRTISDPVDLFLSDIPMNASANNTAAWESGAMVEVLAFRNGQPLTLRKGESLEIQLPEISGYNSYSLETASASWVAVQQPANSAAAAKPQTGLLAIEELPAAKRAEYDALLEQQRIEEYKITGPLLPALPAEPRAADRKKNRFNVDFKLNEFPEMKSWGNVVFEVDETNRKFDPAVYKTEWEDVKLLRSGHTGYQIQLRKGVRTETIDVNPALEGQALSAAQADYTAAAVKRSNLLAKREADLAELRKTIAEKCNALRKRDLETPAQQNVVAGKSIRTGHFGIFAALRKIVWPAGNRASSLTLLSEDGKPLAAEQICHVQQGTNSVFRRNGNAVNGFSYNAAAKNQLWVVSNGKLYAAGSEQFTANSTDLKITLKPVPANAAASADALRRYFGF
ncbi:MAG: hypothetical protein ACRC3B_18200, partial [Bacteroidia bacterium]